MWAQVNYILSTFPSPPLPPPPLCLFPLLFFPSSPLRFLSSFLPSPLNQVVSLLSLGSFIEVMSQLVEGAGGTEGGGGARETRDDVQKKTLEILNTKLEGTRLRFTEEHVSNGAQHHYN